MCYSAMVYQDLRALERRFSAVADWDMFEDLFARRNQGGDVKVSRALERNFEQATSEQGRRIGEAIRAYRTRIASELEKQVFEQRTRLADAERSLAQKETKAARDSARVARNKIQSSLDRLTDLKRTEAREKDERIFPLMYAPVLVRDGDRLVLRPMRYTCRLAGMPPESDRKYAGTYNARRDNLTKFWARLYGRNHAVLVVSSFFENVAKHHFERRALGSGEKEENVVLHFNPQVGKAGSSKAELLVACLWDHWVGPSQADLYSFAAITDEPPPEIAAAGHNRCVVPLREENLSAWLDPSGASRDDLAAMLDDRYRPFYEHRLVA